MSRRGPTLLWLALLVTACGGEPEAQAPVARETPEDDILRIARTWTADLEETGFRSPPSRVEMFTRRERSTVTFTRGVPTAHEVATFDETFKLSDGTSFRCQATETVAAPVAFGDHAGESAVEIRTPARRLTRACDRPGFPEPQLEIAPVAARFALRADRLVPFAPVKEKRNYLPGP